MKQYISILTFLFLSISLLSQDTVTVQTFTWDSTSRSAIFSFPDNPGESYRKILMEYNMRCHDDLVGNGAVGCREWDYHCNTVITDPSAQDSIKATHPSHVIGDFDGDEYEYTSIPTYSYIEYLQQDVQYTSSDNEAEYTFNDDGSNSEIGAQSANSKYQVVIPAAALLASGISNGDIDGIKFYFMQDVSIPFYRIRMKHLDDAQEYTAQLDGFSEHYFKSTDVSEGENHFAFHTPFQWDGSSSIMVEMSHTSDQAINIRYNAMPVTEAVSFSTNRDDYFVNFQGTDYFDIDANIFSETDSILTISMWTRGDRSLPAETFLFLGNDDEGRRNASSHLPWTNAQIFWDSGNDGSNYDRISKAALETDFESVWTNWTFIKNVNQLSMSILKNGEVWHTEAGKNKTISITDFILGNNAAKAKGYLGDIDDLRIWNQDVDPFTIRQWLYRPLDDTHPYSDFLIGEFSFNEGQGQDISSSITDAQGFSDKAPNWRKVRGKDLWKYFEQRDLAPKVSFVQGDYTIEIEELAVLDSTINATNRVISYFVDQNKLEVQDTSFYYSAAPSPVYNESGDLIRSIDNSIEGSIEITTLNFYNFQEARYEILSFITPYGNGLDLGPNGVTYTIDMTDYTPILKGDKMMSIEGRGNNQEELDIKFHFIKGTPHAEIRELKQIWPIRNANQVWSGHSIGNIINDVAFEPRDIFIQDDVGYVKLRSAITGHGSAGEFTSRQHFVNVNGGFQEALYNVWKECGDNPVYPQGGTWIFDRAGWCPGMETDVHTFEIGPFLNKGEFNEFDYGITGSTGTNMDYRINNQLVIFEEANFSNDVEILDILNPSTKTEHQRFNPSCNLPHIIIRNGGSELLQSIDITYGMEEGDSLTTSWTGNVRYLDTKQIELEVLNDRFWKSGNGNFFVRVSNPNGQSDENTDNSYMSSKYTTPFTSGKDLRVDIRTDNKPQDSRINIFDASGDLALDLFGFGSNSTYSLDLDLPDGCYTMVLQDASDDGLEFWFFPNNGVGWARIAEDNLPVQTFDPDFGGDLIFDFIVDKVVSTEENQIAQAIGISPNPAYEELSVLWSSTNTLGGKMRIIDQNGKVLAEQATRSNQETILDVDFLMPGFYFISIESDAGLTTKKFIKM